MLAPLRYRHTVVRRYILDEQPGTDVLGLKTAFINQLVEVPAVRGQLAALLGPGDKRPDIVMWFGYGPLLPYSLRRAAEDVLGDDRRS